jgi:apolipoprotein N-acyltransferase
MRRTPHPLFFSALSALLLSLSWYFNLSILAFFGFIPLLRLERLVSEGTNKRKNTLLFLYVYPAFLAWNVAVTWWVAYASAGGAVMAFVFNALFMAMVFVIFSAAKNAVNRPWATWLLLPLWIAWEHAHTLWDISWTWLTLGNVFAYTPSWIQWYEFTGTSGGSLWILALNIMVFRVISNADSIRQPKKYVLPFIVLALPIVLSQLLVMGVRIAAGRETEEQRVLIVQPNIDPYNEKFAMDYQSQFFKMLGLIKGKVTAETDYLVLPETFITGLSWYGMEENTLDRAEEIQWFRDSLISRFPDLKIVAGGNTYRYYEDGESVSATARKDKQTGLFFDVYNTAIYIDKDITSVYHKSKLVPGVERMPFPALMKPLERFAIDLGGTVGSLGTQEERAVFRGTAPANGAAPVICYESVYADYVSEYIRKGAGLIFIVTNDGWWEDTPGYVQHLHIGRLRAIENRRQIGRSANTGISCFIDETGSFHQLTPWWEEAVIEQDMHVNRTMTFFSRFGDLISRAAVLLALSILAAMLYLGWKRRRARAGNLQEKKV